MGGGDSTRYEIGQGAYIKVVLHALKHKTSSVNGLLLGRLLNADDKDAVVEIADSVPLSHAQIGLLPTLEIALIHVIPSLLSFLGFLLSSSSSIDY